ncbi:MAG: amino acid adenylation domain-containing protein [Fluviicola sp.]|nr:amino acid adenylation domain-containing protein [Fluviicola sp.]
MKNNQKYTGLEIAVIGMACRYPGANNWREYWNNLVNGVESVQFLSDEELLAQGVDERTLKNPNFVKSNIFINNKDCFDSKFFDYRPMDATFMNPMHRIYHECMWEALEDSGYNPDEMKGSIGLFAGGGEDLNWKVFSSLKNNPPMVDELTLSHLNNKDYLGSLLAYKLNLKGPTFTMNTACSTSLVAINLACKSLLLGESKMAVAGGVSIDTRKRKGYMYEEGSIVSMDGHCRAFDKNASGTVWSEGAGAVVLKRLTDAIKDGDQIYSVIKGSAINNDGNRKVGFTAPSVEGQVECIRKAQKFAKVEPESISYIETHGTATKLGDPIEVEALNIAFNWNKDHSCAIGSVKTNIGHSDAAAGVAGLIKASLCLKYKQIPASLNYTEANEEIDFEAGPFYVNTELRDWENKGDLPLRAGVSSFGVGGTNAHVILEEAPALEKVEEVPSHKIMTLSAKTEKSFNNYLESLKTFVEENPDLDLDDMAYTYHVGRKHFRYRKSFVFEDRSELLSLLETSQATDQSKIKEGSKSVVFLFSGQGSQYLNMGKGLYDTDPFFRSEMDKGFELIQSISGQDFKAILFSDSQDDLTINQTRYAQGLIFLLEHSLAQLLLSYGVTPNYMIGHSIGEYVAACLDGVFSFEDAIRLVLKRGELMYSLAPGVMFSVSATKTQINQYLNDRVSLAGINGPEQLVLSGDSEAMEMLSAQLNEKGVPFVRLHTSHAFHSSMQDSILDAYRTTVESVTRNPLKKPFISNLTGEFIKESEATSAEYWVRHLRETVQFSKGIETLLSLEEELVFVEVGAGHSLSSLVKQHLGKTSYPVVNLLRTVKEKEDDSKYVTNRIGRLWSAGVAIDWNNYHQNETRRRISLPTYAFERIKYLSEVDPYDFGAGMNVNMNNQPDKELSDWFYLPSWKSSSLSHKSRTVFETPPTLVMFTENSGIGEALEQKYIEHGWPVIKVIPGTSFKKESENSFEVNPLNNEDFNQLFEAIYKGEDSVLSIVYLWGISAYSSEPLTVKSFDEAHDLCFYGLINIAKSIGDTSIIGKVILKSITSSLFNVLAGEKVNTKSAIGTGPIYVIPHEYPNVYTQNIDIEYYSTKAEATLIATDIFNELLSESTERIISFRKSQRWIRTFEPVHIEESTNSIQRFKDDGIYVITGGTGGIGLALAETISKGAKAKLILVGRSHFPSKDTWANEIEGLPEYDIFRKTLTRLTALEDAGTEIIYMRADVSDDQAMKELSDKIHATYGKVDGIIHSAGVPDGKVIQFTNKELTDKIFASKIKGAILLKKHFGDASFMIVCSSINSVLSSPGQVGYIAGNNFLDAFTHDNTANGFNTIAINWNVWQDSGLAVNATLNQYDYNRFEVKESRIYEHPIYKKRVDITNDEIAFLSYFNPEKSWFLNEHRIYEGNAVMPGTGYIELIRSAVELLEKSNQMAFHNLVFKMPMIAEDGKDREVQTLIKREKGRLKTLIRSRDRSQSYEWITHIEVEVELIAKDTQKRQMNLDEIRQMGNDELTKVAQNNIILYDNSLYGPRWENRKSVLCGKDFQLTEIALKDEFLSDLLNYKLHPAIFDMCTQYDDPRKKDDEPFLPFAYKKLTILGEFPGKVYSYIRSYPNNNFEESEVWYDISVLGEDGTVLVDIEKFTLMRIPERAVRTKKGGVRAYSMDNEAQILAQGKIEGISDEEGKEIFARLMDERYSQVFIWVRDLNNELKQQIELAKKESNVMNHEQSSSDGFSFERPELSVNYEAPVTKTEQVLAEVWKSFFSYDKIGVHDDFFELGGDSLKVMSVTSLIQKKLNVSLQVNQFFSYPTIKELAEYLDNSDENQTTSEIVPVEKREYYPVSAAQKRMFVMNQMALQSTNYNFPFFIELSDQMDVLRLEEAFSKLIMRHESLRTSFKLTEEGVVQVIHNYEDLVVKLIVTDTTKDRVEKEFNRFLRPFDLSTAPLFRMELLQVAGGASILLVDLHHIIADAMSLEIIRKELFDLYSGADLPELTIQYKDFAAWQNEAFKSGIIENQKKYWLSKFENEIPVLELPLDYTRPDVLSFEGATYNMNLNDDLYQQIKGFTQENNITMYMFFLSVYYIMLHKYSGQDDIVIGSFVLGRNHADLQNMIGMFINTLPIRNYPSDEKTGLDFLNEVKQSAIESFENMDYQYDDLVDNLKLERTVSRNAIFDVTFSYMSFFNDGSSPERPTNTSTTAIEKFLNTTAKNDFNLMCTEGDKMAFEFEYCTKLFKAETIERMATAFETIAFELVAEPRKKIASINLISESEKTQLLTSFNATEKSFRSDKTIVELFEEQVDHCNDKVALIASGKFYSYNLLNEKANQLASYLREQYNVGPNDVVGIKLERSEWMVITILAILKSGGAYTPIDPEFPQNRIDFIVNDSQCKVVIDEAELEKFNASNNYSNSNLIHSTSPNDSAYVIYTSGSTGNPKGCLIEHKSLVNRLDWMWNELNFNTNDVILQKTNYTFDVSVWELLMPLCYGAQMVICPKEDAGIPEKIVSLIAEHQVSCLHFVPSMLNAFVAVVVADDHYLKTVRGLNKVITSGEALSAEIVNKWYANTDVVLHNLYGPTEATIDVTWYKTAKDDERIPIGKPIWNTHMYILSESLELTPIGIIGDICISGVGLSRGYLNNPELTDKQFVGHPFEAGSTLYKTGDLGRWLPDGNIEYVGRKDDQVKIRGYRIEIGEIENALLHYSGIESVAVIVKEDLHNEKQLMAYYTGKTVLNTSEIRLFLGEILPVYMLPVRYIQLDAIPLTTSGKINRKMLPDVNMLGAYTSNEYVAPRNELEEKIVDIWEEVLGREKIGVTDNFFELGGDSLKVIQVITRLQGMVDLQLNIQNVFKYPTIGVLAEHVSFMSDQNKLKIDKTGFIEIDL